MRQRLRKKAFTHPLPHRRGSVRCCKHVSTFLNRARQQADLAFFRNVLGREWKQMKQNVDMGKLAEIDSGLKEFIESQPLFFVATAPLDAGAHINVSPKG